MKTYYVGNMPISDELFHHGIKGQKWGIRRWQNEDGSLTAAGKAKYGTVENFNRIQERNRQINEARKGRSLFSSESRENRSLDRHQRSVQRGKQLYDKGYSSGKNILKTSGKVALKTIGTTAAVSFGLLALHKIFHGNEISEGKYNTIRNMAAAAGIAAGASSLRKGIKRELDYQRYRSSNKR